MSQFYARYVPPAKISSKTNTTAEDTSKRKRHVQPGRTSGRFTSKRQRLDTPTSEPGIAMSHANAVTRSDGSGDDVLKKYSISQFARENGTEATRRDRRKKHEMKINGDSLADTGPLMNGNHTGTDVQESLVRTKDGPQRSPEVIPSKHLNVMSRFERSKTWSANHKDRSETGVEDGENDTDTVHHGLNPLPQPEPADLSQVKPSFSSLPLWQANALAVDRSELRPFTSMSLSRDLVTNLKRNNVVEAFPVQSTLIPLLLDDHASAGNDICVSATTGSGKTLAYAIPIIEDLRKSRQRSLRAVIVVPTRELVKQVKEACEICASGSGLQIVTAVGSKSLEKEQKALIEAEEIYDPTAYREQQNAPIDWLTLDLAAEVESARHNVSRPPPDFVVQRRMKADVLITTPGRLVDHLKRTNGFHLDDVRWLVVDEADRLLNESYQEWIDVVMPALQSRNATKERDRILSSMRMDLPARRVRKILLSATMTRDISKLNALELHHPRLVVLNSDALVGNAPQPADGTVEGENDTMADESESFYIPTTLTESVVAFKDGAEKPLVLFQLLRKISKEDSKDDQGVNHKDISDVTSSSGSSDSDESDSSESSSATSSDSESLSSSDDDDSSASESSSVASVGQKSPQHRADRKRTLQAPRVLIFTKSTSSASRLARLLTLLSPDSISDMATLTRSTASSASSRKALAAFRASKIHILISTDRASRGIDVPGLEHVVNYDIPASALTYVHRVGRTARAGLSGHSWTILEHREGRWFWNEIGGKSESCKIRRSGRMTRSEASIDDDALRQQYEQALQKLGEEVRGQ